MFSKQDIELFEKLGKTEKEVLDQIEVFKKGIPFINLDRPASLEDGISSFDEKSISDLLEIFENEQRKGRFSKFVPASGAATRMFKTLLHFYNTFDKLPLKDTSYYGDEKEVDKILDILENLDKFAFYNTLIKTAENLNISVDNCIQQDNYKPLIKCLIDNDAMNYSNLPKAFLEFHKYDDYTCIPLEEHFVEGSEYCASENGDVNIHFTLSPEFIEKGEELSQSIAEKYKDYKFNTTFSVQKPSTDTIAVNPDNTPFRNSDGSLLFRPAGHGALIENLNDYDGDIVFIKNIDNVVPDRMIGDTLMYKKVIGGYLVKLTQKINSILHDIDNNNCDLDDAEKFITAELGLTLGSGDRVEAIKNLLNRPVRVCGMVKNTGEPGGGPFWVKGQNGVTLQIVETSQIDKNNPGQSDKLSKATHFNPVDLVCSVKDYKGNKFDLKKFVDNETAFISEKSKDGKPLKALELPGLWNGAMAGWITKFVEVPITTFNPVKTINDLLRPEHQ